MRQSEIIIVGAGIAGLTAALALSKLPVQITVVERKKLSNDEAMPLSRTAAIMTGGLLFFKDLGLLPEILDIGSPLKAITIIDDHDFPRGGQSMVQQRFDAQEVGEDYFGYNVPLGALRTLLLNHVRAKNNITIKDGLNLSQDDEILADADLIIGADGRHSFIRESAGIQTVHKDYGQTAITCLIHHTGSHTDTSVEFHRSGGPCTFVPVGDKTSAVVWVEKTAQAEEFIALSKHDFTSALQKRSRDILGQIELESSPESWPLKGFKAQSLTAPKTVLIAEAAHALSPIGAQGLNLSLRDVVALTDTVKNALALGQPIGGHDVLTRYEQARLPDINMRYRAVNGLSDWVQTENTLAVKARRAGLKALDHLPPLRRFLMEKGLGMKSG